MRKSPALLSNLMTFNHPNPKGGAFHWKPVLFNLIRNNEIEQAHQVFSKIPSPNAHLYTMMINACSRSNRIDDAFKLFGEMPNRDAAAWNSMIKGCLDCGELGIARKLFDEMPDRNVISWTTMVDGLMKCGRIEDAVELFGRMPLRDTAAWNSMISGYCNNGKVRDGLKLFERMPRPNVVSWTAMIGGHERNGEDEEALGLFKQMWVSEIKPTSSTFACALTACAKVSDMGLGSQLHSHVVKIGYVFDTYVSTSLVTLYAECGHVENSARIFYENGDRTVIPWTALVTGYGANGRHEDALREFHEMVAFGTRPNQSTFTSALNSCSGLEALDRGKTIHCSAIKRGLELDVFVGNSLVVLYSRSGDMDDGLKVFTNMGFRNIVSWNAAIVGCAQNGHGQLAIKFFDDMMACVEEPDGITFLGVLTACSHCRLLEKGRYFFRLLEENPAINVKLEHYVCMVDVLGRSGNFVEAEEFIKAMPVRPNATVWLALLSACRLHSNIEVARRAAREVLGLDPYNSGAYIVLSNIYASAGRWSDASQTRLAMRLRGIVKTPGSSWVVLKDSRHEFVCGGRSHPMTVEIHAKLGWLSGKLKECGYACDERFVLHDVDDEQKEAALAYHSEKLAVAFGLLATVDGSTIRVFKNLRVCGDCHSAMKLISRVVGREIVLRDSTRFHHFGSGSCSCGDYW